MKAVDYWSLFMDTGAPEAYVAYIYAQKREESHVPDDQGTGAAGHGLQ